MTVIKIDKNKQYNREDFVFFWGGLFSNFAKIDGGIDYKGNNFPTTEHAFMYAKALHFKDYEVANQLLNVSRDPKKAKALGRKVKNFNDIEWDKVKYEIMKEVNLLKYKKEVNKKRLLETGNKILVESSPYDNIWGIKMHESERGIEYPNNWKGQNLLGKVLMEVRDKLK